MNGTNSIIQRLELLHTGNKCDFNDLILNRITVRARLPLNDCFDIQFAPDHEFTSESYFEDSKYCLIAHEKYISIWDFSKIYTHRLVEDLNGAKLIKKIKNEDVVSNCVWMPAENSESFEIVTNEEKEPKSVTMPSFFTATFDKTIKFYRKGLFVSKIKQDSEWVRFLDIDTKGEKLLAGCVNSNIFCWDTTLLTPLWKISPGHFNSNTELLEINSINGLKWSHKSSNIFASGAADGTVKIWDSRMLDNKSDHSNSTCTVIAHNGKLNNINWTNDDNKLLTSGRDNVIRLHDLRMLKNEHPKNLTTNSNGNIKSIQEYSNHDCGSYNVQANFWQDEKMIVTGSKNGNVFIYDTFTGENVKTLQSSSKPIHITLPLPHLCGGPGLVTSAAMSSSILIWAPTSSSEDQLHPKLNNLSEPQSSIRQNIIRESLEITISHFGNQILHNFLQTSEAENSAFNLQVQRVHLINFLETVQRYRREFPLENIGFFEFDEFDQIDEIDETEETETEEN